GRTRMGGASRRRTRDAGGWSNSGTSRRAVTARSSRGFYPTDPRVAGTRLLTLPDDIATLPDDVSVMTKVAARKTAGDDRGHVHGRRLDPGAWTGARAIRHRSGHPMARRRVRHLDRPAGTNLAFSPVRHPCRRPDRRCDVAG